jgi:hypothetical protein
MNRQRKMTKIPLQAGKKPGTKKELSTERNSSGGEGGISS